MSGEEVGDVGVRLIFGVIDDAGPASLLPRLQRMYCRTEQVERLEFIRFNSCSSLPSSEADNGYASPARLTNKTC